MGILDGDIDWTLLGASLLANNQGHYGALGPALGSGLLSYGKAREGYKVTERAEEQRKAAEAAADKLGLRDLYDMNPKSFTEAYLEAMMESKFPGADKTGKNLYYAEKPGTPGFKGYVIGPGGKAVEVRPEDGYAWAPRQSWRDFGGYQAPMPAYGAPQAQGSIPGVPRTQSPGTAIAAPPTATAVPRVPGAPPGAVPNVLKPGEQPSVRGAQEAAVQQARTDAEIVRNQPFDESKLRTETIKYGVVEDLFDQAEKQIGMFTTGFPAQMTKEYAWSPAHDLMLTLDGIKANLGFDRLQSMRDQSPTGGALGQVSEFENRLLQSVWGSLEQSASEEMFRERLEMVRDTMELIIHGRYDEYIRKHGGLPPGMAKPNEAGWRFMKEAIPLPPKINAMTMKVGRAYITDKGILIWNGQAFEEPE